jgi:hypothetical protein
MKKKIGKDRIFKLNRRIIARFKGRQEEMVRLGAQDSLMKQVLIKILISQGGRLQLGLVKI